MIRYALTIFLGACLLFQVQPLIGKHILPWFGGVPAVWTTCMLFFQSLLLVGYAYAHCMTLWLRPRAQCATHLVVLLISGALLPIAPAAAWKPTDSSFPIARILLLLLVSVGGPYLVLASTSPLLQSWFSKTHPGRSPYRLYSLSNAGSLLGLCAYPFLVEWMWTLQVQINVWSSLYGLYLVLCGFCALDLWREGQKEVGPAAKPDHNRIDTPLGNQSAPSSPNLFDMVLWLALSTCGSVMLLATTNRMCQDVASIPFLWVLPLGLYLLSFIVLFGREELYSRSWFSLAMMLAVGVEVVLRFYTLSLGISLQIALNSFVLTVVCFVCHGELVHLKPSARHLTLFYLTMSAGGALGGILVTIGAPLLFSEYYEFSIGLGASMVLLLVTYRRDHWKTLTGEEKQKQRWRLALYGLAVVIVTVGSMWSLSVAMDKPGVEQLTRLRNFYGSLKVERRDGQDEQLSRVVMAHGNTIHGMQFEKEEKHQIPTLYYTYNSGVGVAIQHHPRRSENRPLRIGMVGLGAGTLCCYARQGDFLCFYEIDPLVVKLSREYFTFQEDAIRRGADVKVLLGDARIVMERQAAKGERQEFDILVVDAFTSDAIPLHLLTRECFELYFQHLKPSGILAVHISNRHLDLRPVVKAASLRGNCEVAWIVEESGEFAIGSEWGLVTRNTTFLADPTVQLASQTWDDELPLLELTDDYSTLFQLLR